MQEEKPNYLNIIGLICFFALIAGWAVNYMLRLTIEEYLSGNATFFTLVFSEIITISGLTLGITGVVARKSWSKRFFMISSGMLIYATVFTLGKYFETHRHPFLILSLFTAAILILLLAGRLFFKKNMLEF